MNKKEVEELFKQMNESFARCERIFEDLELLNSIRR